MTHITTLSDNTIAKITPSALPDGTEKAPRSVLSQEAADFRVKSDELKRAKLDQPKAVVRTLQDLVQRLEQMDLSCEILLLLLKSSLEARENNKALRNIQQEAMIDSLQAQVEEIKAGSHLMIAMAVVSGVCTALSAVGGGYGVAKGGNLKFDGLSKKEQFTLGKEFDVIQSQVSLSTSATQGISQMSQNAIAVKQKESEADAKKYESQASITEKERQKAEEQVQSFQQLLADSRQLLKEMTSNAAQTFSAAAAV